MIGEQAGCSKALLSGISRGTPPLLAWQLPHRTSVDRARVEVEVEEASCWSSAGSAAPAPPALGAFHLEPRARRGGGPGARLCSTSLSRQ